MNKQMYDICSSVMEKALKLGADECKVKYYKNREVEIGYLDEKPEIIKEAISQNIIINLYIDGKFSSFNTPDLRKNALDSFLIKAVENTRYVEKDPARFLPPHKYIKNREEKELQVFDPGYDNLTNEKRHNIAKTIESVCLEKGGDKVISTEAEMSDSVWEEVVVASNGFEGYSKTSDFWAGASMTMQDEGDRRPGSSYFARWRNIDDMPSLDEIGEKTIKNTRDLLGAKKIQTENFTVIIENRVVSNLLNRFLSALYGNNIQQKKSFLSEMKGKNIGSKYFTLLDDPFIIKGFGSRLYDFDGFPTKKRIIVNEGRLEEFYIDWYYSRKLNCEPTTGSLTNLLLPHGNKSVSELMQDIGRGILVTGFIGGNSNSATGDFSIGITGQLFENGKPVQSISEMNLADNHLKFWNKLIAAGNDPWKYSSMVLPSLVFENVTIAGI